jgi:uncharacterized membrane protein
MSMFPHDAAKRIVIVTDGNENMGDALAEARAVTDAGVSIDVVPVPLERRSEVSVEKVALPADVRRGQPFEVRVVLNNDSPSGETVKGSLKITREAGQDQDTLVDVPIELPPGKSVRTIDETIEFADFYKYEAQFIPDGPDADNLTQNNRATHFTDVRGKGHVLLIENSERQGEFGRLVESLQTEGLRVTLQPSNQLFGSLTELQRYDTVILANVPRSNGFETTKINSFSDEQIRMLVRNTEELGCGLIMIGGDNSFGAGDWARTEIEKAMPVDFTIKSAKVIPVGALVLNMHAGEIPDANHWQKVIAAEAIKTLGARDYCGLVQWNGTEQWLWGQRQGGLVRVGPNRKVMLASIDRMNIGDMPAFEGSMKMAAAAFNGVKDAAIKHMIIISDGDPSKPTPGTMAALKKANVKVTTVLVGDPRHAPGGRRLMLSIANQTGGKFYAVNNAKALPRIYQREARRVTRPIVFEPDAPVRPRIQIEHEIVRGLTGELPPIRGLVLTTVKESSLVEVVARSPLPANAENSAVLAAWTYGLGKTVAFTTDAGNRWADAWTEWPDYDRFFSQMVRWSMRPTGDTGKFTIATDVGDGKTRVVISALDKNDEYLNYQTLVASALGPNADEEIELNIQQTAPGHYVGEFESSDPGSYLIMVRPGAGQAPIRTGVNVGYSDEFRSRETNTTLLESMASLSAKGGESGTLVAPLPAVTNPDAPPPMDEQLAVDPFRRDLPAAVASRDIWPMLVLLGSCVFLADVFVRRVQIGFDWLDPVWQFISEHILRRQRQAAQPQTMSRLRSRKAEIDEQIQRRRAATRFEAAPETPIDPTALEAAQAKPSTTQPPSAPEKKSLAEGEQPAEDDYTSRLLKAKKQMWKDRDK